MGFSSLQIGKSALIAANYGLQVTGQNMSNVGTTGYSRQTLNQSGASGVKYGSYLVGSGVTLYSISRTVDTHAEKQLLTATSANNYACNLESAYTNIQNVLAELSGTAYDSGNALSDAMNSFRESLSDLSSHVETLSNRSTLLETALTMTDRFNDISATLAQYRTDANQVVEDSVAQINTLLNTVAQLNKSIVSAESGGLGASTANDLRDQRGEALRQLSELTNIEVTDEANGSCIVSINGRSMVYFDQVYEVGLKYEKSGDMTVATPVFAKDSYPLNASGGVLAAQVEIRDEILKGYLDDLDDLASAFTWEFNQAYSQTRGTEAYDSLTSLYSPIDPAVTLDQLTYGTSTVDGTFQIVDGNLEMIVYNNNTGQETSVNIEIDLDGRDSPDGESDMILWDPANPDAGNSLINRLQTALDEAVPGAFTVTIDNQYRVTIESASTDYGFCFGSDTSGVLAALGMNVLFTGHTASDISVNSDLSSNPQYFGVATSFSGGDNTGLESLIEFLDTGLDRLGGQTPEEYYQTIAGRLGGEASRAVSQKTLKADLLLQASNRRESVSGVNEDEESLNLMAYQRAYQSAARFISVVDEMYDTLLSI